MLFEAFRAFLMPFIAEYHANFCYLNHFAKDFLPWFEMVHRKNLSEKIN